MRTLVPGYPAVLDALRGAETVHALRAPARRAGAPARRARRAASTCSCSTRRISTRGPAIPTSARTAATGPTTRCASRRSARAPPRSAAGWCRRSRPTSCTRTTGRPALAPAYLHYGGAPRPGTVMTVHNLAFQGQFPRELLADARPAAARAARSTASNTTATIGFLKAGLALADRITTVSPTYAAEIRTPEGGMGLDGLLRQRADVLSRHPQRHRRRRSGIRRPIRTSPRRFDARHLRRRARATRRRCRRASASTPTPTALAVRRGQPADLAEGHRPAARGAAGARGRAARSSRCSAPATRRSRRGFAAAAARASGSRRPR